MTTTWSRRAASCAATSRPIPRVAPVTTTIIGPSCWLATPACGAPLRTWASARARPCIGRGRTPGERQDRRSLRAHRHPHDQGHEDHADTDRPPDRSGERLLEPVVAVALVVERLHLDVTGGAVHRDRFAECPVRLEPRAVDAAARASASRAASRRRPTPRPRAPGATHIRLISAGSRPWKRSAPHPTGSAREVGDEQQTGRLGQVGEVGEVAERGIEAVLEAIVELGVEAPRHAAASADVGSSGWMSTSPAVKRRSTTSIASTSRARCSPSSDASSDSAKASLAWSRASRSSRPAGVSATAQAPADRPLPAPP